jgi:DNA modification methylase
MWTFFACCLAAPFRARELKQHHERQLILEIFQNSLRKASPSSEDTHPMAGRLQSCEEQMSPPEAGFSPAAFESYVRGFDEFGKRTISMQFFDGSIDLTVYINEFWTSKQRVAHSLHEISYRACFKPQLPRFFIQRLTKPGDAVYDPFMGRGTTLLEAALLGRKPLGCDINPLSDILIRPRLDPPASGDVIKRLQAIDLNKDVELREDLRVFYHPKTLRAIVNLRSYLMEKSSSGVLDDVDRWIRMVATNRLTGHSTGFLSVYTMPPNQAVSIESQRRINQRRSQVPPERDLKAIVMRKTRSLLKDLEFEQAQSLRKVSRDVCIITGRCDRTPSIPDQSVNLVATSPPFLNVVDYQTDNWLRCWFNGIDASAIPIWQIGSPQQWQARMEGVLGEMKRILVPGGFIAFEVGEVLNGKLLLENLVVPSALSAGLTPVMVMVNDQVFTKTSNCWGVRNLAKGTNTNRIVLLHNP